MPTYQYIPPEQKTTRNIQDILHCVTHAVCIAAYTQCLYTMEQEGVADALLN